MTRNRSKPPNILALGASILVLGCGAPRPPSIRGTVVESTVASTNVGDSYRVLVRLPPSYSEQTTQRFPVVVQLDATSFGPQFNVMAGVVSEMAAAQNIPEAIVVGVGYPYEAGFGERRGRWRDYRTRYPNGDPAGAQAFLRFLREELLPDIHGRFRTMPDRVTLCGHSLGGYFTLVALYSTASDAVMPFSRFIAVDPTLSEDNFHLLDLDASLATSAPAAARLHLSIARYNGAVQRLYFDVLSERLSARAGLSFARAAFETDHGDAVEPGFRAGITHSLGAAP